MWRYFYYIIHGLLKTKKKHNKLDTKQKTEHNVNHVTKNEWSTSMNDKWVLGEV